MQVNDDITVTSKVQFHGQHMDSENQNIELTPPEAEKLIEDMTNILTKKNKVPDSLRQKVQALKVGKGYLALCCDSLHACFKEHFDDKSIAELYREVDAAKVETNLYPDSQIGENPRALLLELGKLKNTEDQQAALAEGMKLCKPGKKPSAEMMKPIVKKAHLNGAPASSSRVEKSLKVPDEEILKKRAVALLKKLKSDVDKLDADAQLNVTDVCQKIENLEAAFLKVQNIESITSIDCKSEPEVVESFMDIFSPDSSDLVEDPAVSITMETAMPLPVKLHKVQPAGNMLQVKIKLPNQKHPKPKKIARNEQKPVISKKKPLAQNSTLSAEEIKLMLPKSTIPIVTNLETFFADNLSCARGFDYPVLNLEFPPDMA